MVNWGMLAAVIFVSVNVSLFVVSLASEYKRGMALQQWFWDAWAKRQKIAAPVLSACYDTGTDLGVIILWYQMMRDEKKDGGGVKHIDMEIFFALGVVFMILPRLFTAATMLVIPSYTKAVACLFLFDFLWLYDFYYMDGSDDDFDVTLTVQLTEAVCEAIPQMITQSIFLILTSDAAGLGAVDYILMVASLIASAASITHRVVGADYNDEVFKEGSGADNALVFGWRFCQVVTRMCVFSLLFATVGPIFLPVYFVLSLCAFWYFFKPTKHWEQWFTLLLSPIVIFHDLQYLSAISPPQAFRRYDNFLALVIIAIFMFIGFDCVVCADSSFRTRNPFAEGLFFAAFICFVAETVLFVSVQPLVSKQFHGGVVQAAAGKQIAGGTQATAIDDGPALPPGFL